MLVVRGGTVVFSIYGQERYGFTSEKKTYSVYIGQLMNAVQGEPFMLTVTIE